MSATRGGTLSGTLPRCLVARGGTASLTPNQWLTWHPDVNRAPAELPAEWVLRALQTADLDDPVWLLTMLDVRGMVWSPQTRLRNPAETPEELGAPILPPRDDLHATVHLSDVHVLLVALRAAGAQWLAHVRTGAALPESFWWLLHAGTSQFSAVTVYRNDRLEGDLFEAGCWQLFLITRDKTPVKRCQNEPCGRVFYRQDSISRYGGHAPGRTKYCSVQCREAQKKRAYRRQRTNSAKCLVK